MLGLDGDDQPGRTKSVMREMRFSSAVDPPGLRLIRRMAATREKKVVSRIEFKTNWTPNRVVAETLLHETVGMQNMPIFLRCLSVRGCPIMKSLIG